ncbi:serine/threonine protein kinase [Marivirga sp. S37H4]|uniref:Serine/threonine protein kinase n=1 Tax=Marivirga aurantiaca TaxID=2802615 RepID=A0A934X066_9BACT|nr:serine/threonine-protein kinase [Marivirga aurantiaca]MBK6265970.1 serine/threonine protein kinase [Marivirga aurantiaca]
MEYNWSELEKIFNESLELSPSERTNFIINKSEGNLLLQETLLDMLRHSEESEVYFHRLKGEIAQGLCDKPQTILLQKGDIINKYVVTSLLGQGGMGEVYLAQRNDGQYEQTVAIKCFSNPLLKEDFLESFRQEQQFLASLNHANIAHILDGGLTERGIPFIIMDYVEGDPIDKYLEEHKKNLKEKLYLFLEICETIQFAHNQLILHLDIKPNNILVSKEGKIKLLDFGIAKKIGSSDISNTNIMASPFYAAPEQLNQQNTSVATDIYQLGVLFHIILCGDIPFDKTEDMVTNRALKINTAKVGKELLAILSTCLKEKPEERYLSVNELIGDVKNYLAGFPVTVYSNQWLYKANKFIRRNKIATSLVILLFLSLTIGVVVSTRQTILANEQTVAAQIAAMKSERVSDFLISIFESANPEIRGRDKLELESLIQESIHKIKLYPDDEIKAELLFVLGTTFSKAGQYALADSLLAQSIQLNKKLSLSDTENHFKAYFELSKARMYNSQLKESLELIKEAFDLSKKLIPENKKIAGLLTMQLALTTMEAGDTKRADSLLDKAWFETHQASLDPLELAEAYNTKASIKHYKGEIDSSIIHLKKSLAIIKRNYSEGHPFYITLIENLSSGYRQANDFDKALKYQKEAIKKTETIYGKEHLNYIKSANALGVTYRDMDSLNQALGYLEEAVMLAENVMGKETLTYISSAGNLSLTLSKLGKHSDAEIIAYEAYEKALNFIGSKHPFYLWSIGIYAGSLANSQKKDEAEIMYRQALTEQIEVLGQGHPWVKKSATGLVGILEKKGKWKEIDSVKHLVNPIN